MFVVTGQWKQHLVYNNMPQSQSVLQATWPNLQQPRQRRRTKKSNLQVWNVSKSSSTQITRWYNRHPPHINSVFNKCFPSTPGLHGALSFLPPLVLEQNLLGMSRPSFHWPDAIPAMQPSVEGRSVIRFTLSLQLKYPGLQRHNVHAKPQAGAFTKQTSMDVMLPHLFPGHHDVIFTRFSARGMVCADVMLNAPLARVLTVCAPSTPTCTHARTCTHTHTHMHTLANVRCQHSFSRASRKQIKTCNLCVTVPVLNTKYVPCKKKKTAWQVQNLVKNSKLAKTVTTDFCDQMLSHFNVTDAKVWQIKNINDNYYFLFKGLFFRELL